MFNRLKKWFHGKVVESKPLIVEEKSSSCSNSSLIIDQLTGHEIFTGVSVSYSPSVSSAPKLPKPVCSRCGHELSDDEECRWCEKNTLPLKVSKRMLKRLGQYEYLDEISDTDMAVYQNIMENGDPFAREKFPKAVWKALYQRIEEVGDSCVDNLRICDKNDKLQRLLFRIAQENGCCGSETFEFKYRGRTYLLGFNYGH